MCGQHDAIHTGLVHPHQHLHCTSCGSLDDGEATNIEQLGVGGSGEGFVVEEVVVVFRGTCAACADGGG